MHNLVHPSERFRRLIAAMLLTVTLFPAVAAAQDVDVDVEVTVPGAEEANADVDTLVDEFTFTDQLGRTVTREDLIGKPWLACFIFTRCAATCPRITEAMAELQRTLKDTDVQLVSITVDPEFDTPERLAEYAELYRADPDRWRFLSGDKVETFRLLHNSFNVAAADNPGAPPGLQVIHSNNIMHVDADGRVVGKYNGILPEDVAMIRRVLTKGLETPKEHRFVKRKLGIRIGEEPVAEDLATTSPPTAVEEPEEGAREIPDWIRKLPTVNATLNGAATVLLLLGYVLIRGGKVNAHRNVMLAAFALSILFLTSYLVCHAFLGSKPFEGSGFVRPVYFVILITHILLAIPIPVLAGLTIYRGLSGQVERHRRIAKITFPIWLYVSFTGVIIYGMLYHWPQ